MPPPVERSRGARIGTRLVIAIALLGLLTALRALRGPDVTVAVGFSADSIMSAGFLFLFAFVLGGIAQDLNLPRITGYLLGGMLVGPELLGSVTADGIADLSIINGFAIGVIAFVAGAELRPQLLRDRGRAIVRILIAEVGVVFFVLAIGAVLLRAYIPFLAGLPFAAAVALAFVFAAIASVHSPAVTIALHNELKPQGPVSSTTLGVVVAADVLVVLLATVSISTARAVLTPDADLDMLALALIGWELIGALIAGATLGIAIARYLRHVGRRLVIFVIFVVFLGSELASVLHVEFMLFMLATGFFVENVSPVDGQPLIEAIEDVSVPADVMFFSVAGGSIHLSELAVLWPVALGVVIVRAAGLFYGTQLGARWAGAEDSVRRYTWMGLVSQAGVALGLATVASRALGDMGAQIHTMFLAMIAIHEIIGPILFRTALARAGELTPTSPAPAPSSPEPAHAS